MTKLINFLILFYLLITSTALATSDFRTTNIDIMSTLKMFDVSGTSALSVTQQSLSGTPYSISLPGAQGAANTCMVNNGSGVLSWGASGSGVSIVTANGFAGSNSSGAITLSTTVSSGMVKSNGTALQLATAGTDYQAPISLGAFGSTPNANGLSFSSNVLNMQPASASNPGGVSTGTQSFGGSKTFVSPLIVNDAAEDGSNIEVVDPIANKTGTLGQITTNTLLVSYDGVAVVAGANGVGLYSQASPLFSGQVKATDTNTNPASVTPNQGQAVFAILNGSATANTFSTLAFGANQGDSTLVDSAVIGRHVATGSGVESGQLEFWTENAGGGLVEAAVINKTGAFRLNTYGAGCLQSDASGNITSVGGSCGGGGSGTVTSITAGTGLSGGTITTSGTIAVNASQNITTLSNLTSNGIVTTSGGTGALSVTATTGSGSVVLATSPTLVTPALGTPSALVGTNITGTGASFTAGAASALASTPSLCSTGQAPTGILANGNATGCASIGGGSGSSLSQSITQAAHGFSVGNLIYYTGTAYALAKADVDSTSDFVGVVSAVADSSHFTILYDGYVTGLSGLTAGSVEYLSDTTAGALTTTQPTTAGHVSKPILIADSTSSGYVTQSRGVDIASAAPAATVPSPQTLTSTGTQTGILITAAGSSTAALGDTYTNNGHTYTVLQAFTSSTGPFFFSGTGATSGTTFTRATGSGSSTIVATAAANIQTLATVTITGSPLYLYIEMVGGGGGGAAGNNTVNGGAAGGYTVFGTNLLVAQGGPASGFYTTPSAAGASATINSGATGVAISGALGGGPINSGNATTTGTGTMGGVSPYGGAGTSTAINTVGGNAAANSGSGGGGGGDISQSGPISGTGGNAGAFIKAYVTSGISSTYFYSIGAGGAGDTGNTQHGGNGGSGQILVTAYYQ